MHFTGFFLTASAAIKHQVVFFGQLSVKPPQKSLDYMDRLRFYLSLQLWIIHSHFLCSLCMPAHKQKVNAALLSLIGNHTLNTLTDIKITK